MRSNNKNKTKSLTAKSLVRTSLALTAITAALSLATVADAGSFGPRVSGGPMGFLGSRASDHSIRIIDISTSKAGNGGSTLNGGDRTGGKPGKGDGGSQTSDGGIRNDGNGRPHRPRLPKLPIVVAVPPLVTPALVVVQRNAETGAGNGFATGQSSPRRIGGAPAAGERRYVPDEVMIQLAATMSTEAIDAFARRMRLNRVESFSANGITTFRWKIPDPSRRSVPAVIRSLEAQSIVVAAQPNYLYQLQEQPSAIGQPPASGSDPEQYALAKLHLPQAHALAKGDKVLVAVIDSGVDPTHPEFEDMIVERYNALDSIESAHPHGTAVAGAIVAHARLTGVAPRANILAIRAFDMKDGAAEATSYSINKGLAWAMSSGARIINMSFTGPRDPSIEQKVAQARRQGIVLIAAAGNAGPKSEPLYPAAYPDVIAVTATDADDKLYSGANRGRHIAVAAPGVDLLLPAPGKGYQIRTGTSFAAAEVSGIVALLLERKPDLGHDGVRRVLSATARDLGPKGFDPEFGAGLVDAYAAVRSLEPEIATTGARIAPARAIQ
jgi:subtilisin family serine protease